MSFASRTTVVVLACLALAAVASATSSANHLRELVTPAQTLAPRFAEAQTSYNLEGYGGVKFPVHELITSRAAELAGLHNAAKTAPTSGRGSSHTWTGTFARWDLHLSPQYQDITRGVYWNDDPECLSFAADTDTEAYSLQAGGGITLGRLIAGSLCHGDTTRLTCRSHHGDLSFIHAQEPAGGVPAATTKGKMMQWAKLMFECATGRVDAATPVKDLLAGEIADVVSGLGDANNGKTLTELFKVGAGWDVKLRCAGSLAHTIQDSFSGSHARRVCQGAATEFNVGDITGFTAYPLQESGKHGRFDAWIDYNSMNDFTNVGPKIDHVVGGNNALKCTEDIFKAIKDNKSWNDARVLLDACWRLTATAVASSSGGLGSTDAGTPPNCVVVN